VGAPVITTDRLTRAFPSGVAVDHVTFGLAQGEVLALLGPNGAGKTTTVRLLNGVLRPDAGAALVLGFDPAVDGEEVRRRTGVLTENAGLDDRLTTRENLEFTARVRGFTATAARARVDQFIERFGLAERADDLTQGFSTGQRKRVALARALLHDPEVLFLDEPTSGLDPAGTRDVVELIRGLAEEGRTIVMATHFLGEAGRIADRIAVLHRGRLRAFGAPAELAAGIWDGIGAHVDLGAPAGTEALDALDAVPGVLEASASPDGAALRVRDRDVLPVVVAALVGREIAVYGAAAQPPTLEDVYFEIERRILAETGDRDTVDGFSDRYRGVGSS
jgi:ABC-2 type transport system ATP-binding protein